MSNEKVMNLIRTKKIDALLVSDPYNMRHISGFAGGEGIVYVSGQNKAVITDSRYTEVAAKDAAPYGFRVIEEKREHPRTVILRELLEEDRAELVGYEDQFLRVSEFHEYQGVLESVKEWVPMGGLVDELRRIKTQEELDYLAKAEAIGDAAFKGILDFIKPGLTELEIAAELEYYMKKNGAERLSFDSIVASGKNSSMPHAVPSEKKVEEGDFITMDFGCTYKGYCSDMTRTIVVGKADEKQKEIYGVVLEAQLKALAALHAGVTGASVDAVARKVIGDAGYGDCFGHGLGHSVGLYIHENPRLSPTDPTILKAGMIETVEPGIYVPGFGGVRIEDMVCVTEEGCINFAHSPKELIEL
ncbi:MAG: aminopeptidase P family protein [Eubacterium sp.]|nr:aminopeptidase P family protein [Eubacterium sp.]